MEASLKFCLASAVSITMKAYPTILLLGQSNLVRRYLKKVFFLTIKMQNKLKNIGTYIENIDLIFKTFKKLFIS
jgi:hypothetical protein